MPNHKRAKHPVTDVLRQLLTAGTVGTQEEIRTALNKQGHKVNQSKISRLLHKIGAVKVTDVSGKSIYRLPHEHQLAHELTFPKTKRSTSSFLMNITTNGQLIMVHTTPGAAGLVARQIDNQSHRLGILGTIAGDDTILVVPRTSKKLNSLIQKIKALLG